MKSGDDRVSEIRNTSIPVLHAEDGPSGPWTEDRGPWTVDRTEDDRRPATGNIIAAVSVDEHKAQAPAAVGCYVLTVSDTRTSDTDTSGRAIRSLLEEAGHVVSGHDVERDEPDRIVARLRERLVDPATQVVITTGGTGVSSRDGTFEAVTALFEKRLDGFGELFRTISFGEIGAAAMLSRATAGTVGRKHLRAARIGEGGATGNDAAHPARARARGTAAREMIQVNLQLPTSNYQLPTAKAGRVGAGLGVGMGVVVGVGELEVGSWELNKCPRR